jgi:hypothetical protein
MGEDRHGIPERACREDCAVLEPALQEQFNQKVTDARAQQLAAAGLDDVMAAVKNDIQRQAASAPAAPVQKQLPPASSAHA